MVVAPLSSVFLLWLHLGHTHFALAAIHTHRQRRCPSTVDFKGPLVEVTECLAGDLPVAG